MNSRITLALKSAPSSMKALLSDIVLADNFGRDIVSRTVLSLRQASGLAMTNYASHYFLCCSVFIRSAIWTFTLARSCVVCLVLCTLVQTLKSRVRNLAKPYTQSNRNQSRLMKGERGISDITINLSSLWSPSSIYEWVDYSERALKFSFHSVMKCHYKSTCLIHLDLLILV